MIGVVFASEYLRRVKTKAFVLTTLIGPVALIALAVGAAVLVSASVQSEREREHLIAVYDESGLLLPILRDAHSAAFRFETPDGADVDVERQKQAVAEGRLHGFLHLPAALAEVGGAVDARLYLEKKQSLVAERELRTLVRRAMRTARLDRYDLPPEVLSTMRDGISLDAVVVSDDGEEQQASAAGPVAVGWIMAFAVLMIVWIYGGLVMQTTMEEKSSRMAEVLVSSVRPFDLLMGKILSIGAVAATQLAVWLAMLLGIAAVGAVAAGVWLADAEPLANLPPGEVGEAGEKIAGLIAGFRIDVFLVAVLMVPLGFFVSASIFGAVGALYETPQEAQMAVAFLTAPLVLTTIMVQMAGLAPNSALIVFGSFFPFSAPAMLPMRMLLTSVPLWEVLASIATCLASAVGLVWVAGRIFRGTLLNYGKKPTFKDLRNALLAD